jgi:hypothetical protein
MFVFGVVRSSEVLGCGGFAVESVGCVIGTGGMVLDQDEKFIFEIEGVKYLIIHKEALTVEELIDIGRKLGVIS